MRLFVVVCIGYHGRPAGLLRAVTSALSQDGVELRVLVLDSSRHGDASRHLSRWRDDPRVLVRRRACSRAFSSRNALIRWANSLGSAGWMLRLDADDAFAPGLRISSLLRRVPKSVTAVLGGNRQVSRDGEVVGLNFPSLTFLKPTRLLARLEGMAKGRFVDELPSCNLALRIPTPHRYPRILSAEDHFLVARLLLRQPGRVRLLTRTLVTDYTLGGQATADNRAEGSYMKARTQIHAWACREVRRHA